MENNSNTKDKIIVISSMIIILLLVTIFAINNSYQTEQEILNNAYDSLNLKHPIYNETTKFFETYENKNMYVGYISFNDTKTSILKVKQFTNYTNTLIIGSRVLYVSDNNTIIYQKNINRRFN